MVQGKMWERKVSRTTSAPLTDGDNRQRRVISNRFGGTRSQEFCVRRDADGGVAGFVYIKLAVGCSCSEDRAGQEMSMRAHTPQAVFKACGREESVGRDGSTMHRCPLLGRCFPKLLGWSTLD